MLQKELQSLGLTEGEAKAYVALLGLGSSTVGPIAKKSSILYSAILFYRKQVTSSPHYYGTRPEYLN